MPAITEEYITQHLAEALQPENDDSELAEFPTDTSRPAAVLIPLFHASDEDRQNLTWQVLLQLAGRKQ